MYVVHADEFIVTADYSSSGWVAVLSSLHILYLFRYDANNEMLLLQHTIRSTLHFELDTGLLRPETVNPAAAQGGKIVTVSLFSGDLPLCDATSNADICSSFPQQSKSQGADKVPVSEDIESKKRAEEYFLYGEALSNENNPKHDIGNTEDTNESVAANTPDAKKRLSSQAILSHLMHGNNSAKDEDGPDMATEMEMEMDIDTLPKSSARCPSPSQSYVVIADRSGRVCFVHLSTESSTSTTSIPIDKNDKNVGEVEEHVEDKDTERMEQEEDATVTPTTITPRKVFQTPPLGALADRVPVGLDHHPTPPTPQSQPGGLSTITPPLPPPRRYVTAVALVHIGASDAGENAAATDEASGLCLVTICNTGDIIVYSAVTAVESGRGSSNDTVGADLRLAAPIICFQKLGHSLITRRKKTRTASRLKRSSISGGQHSRPSTGSNSGGDQYPDLGTTATSQAMLSIAKDTLGQRALVISGARPLLLCKPRKGMMQVLSLCLPELPYAGAGIHVSNYFSTGQTKGFSVLWREEKVDEGKN